MAKIDRHKAITENSKENMLATSQELVDVDLVSSDPAEVISKETQSQLIVKCPDPCHGVPSTGYQNAADILLDSPIVN